MLMRPLIIAPTLYTEVAACGGFLSKFSGNLSLDINEKGGKIDIREQARFLYINLCDYKDFNGKFVSLKDQIEVIKLISEYLFCTWEVIFWGRKYNNFVKHYEKIKEKIKQRIQFYNPTHIFMQEGSNNVTDNSYLVDSSVRSVIHRLPTTTIKLYTFSTNNCDGVYYPYSSFDEEIKLAAYSEVENLSTNIFATAEKVRSNDQNRGQLVGLKRAEVFKPINIISNKL